MENYLALLKDIVDNGTLQQNRTGIATYRKSGAMLEFDLMTGFPAVTTKKLAFKSIIGELLGFIRGYDNAADFRNLGCKVWDANANQNKDWLENEFRDGEDDLGRIYGVQWRYWNNDGVKIDQFRNLIKEIFANPTSRRLIVNAWNPSDLDKMALPPCHMLFQILINTTTNQMDLVMYQRSCDMFLGIPFNIASYAALLEIIALATGYLPNKLIMMLADVHVYENHLLQVDTQLMREPFAPPYLSISTVPNIESFETVAGKTGAAMKWIESLEPSMFELVDYMHHEPIKGEMAV